ncbi:Histidine protein methyltransferase 1-like [Symbiodinium microadriaticum]|uniref:Histidine protein methyltransferase 1-like n=1 Tax=Symbiodinium microadriaticum TaxID=2951 RepID=A0A1Q9E3C4_SYMMI|nr:Histidine protein methyltransferase 1-like [Symbiodinium microadriaticum]
MSKTFSSQESAGQHVVLAFVWLIVLAVMLAVGMGPTQVAVELNLVSDLHGVSVCNWSDWSDTGGGVFFRDGSTLLGDSREELPISHVTVDKCDFQGFRCVSATLNCRELHLEGIKPLRVVHETQEAGKRPVLRSELQPDSVDQASGGLLWEAGARCLELGAGHGLPGLVALRHGYRVDFHDLSESTLRHITAANCAANDIQIGLPDETGTDPDPPARFVAGDWKVLKQKARQDRVR